MPYTVTPQHGGSATFPANENATYTAIETLAKQEITNAKSSNQIYDGLFDYDIDLGITIEQAIIEKAQSVTFNKNATLSQTPIDPTLVVRYFNNFEMKQYATAIRDKDIRAIIARTGTATVESVAAGIIDSLTQKDGETDFESSRSLILGTNAYDYSAVLGKAQNMDAVLYAMRDIYNQLKYDNSAYSVLSSKTAVPEKDIRIAVSDKLLALLDITKLANVFNLEKVEMMGKLVVIPVGDLATTQWYKIIGYDRKRFNRATRLYEYLQTPKTPGLAVPAYLTTERAYFESSLYKGIQYDVTTAATAEFGKLFVAEE